MQTVPIPATLPAPPANALSFDKFFVPAFQEGYIEKDFDPAKFYMNGIDASKLDVSENRYLLYPFLPRVGTGVLAGMPDTGKSQFARQLCISVATGANHFLDYGLSAERKRALYVATEDDAHHTSFLLNQQLKGMRSSPTENIGFIYGDTLNQAEILYAIDKQLEKEPCDLVVVDAFGDIFVGSDGNNNQAMRRNVKNFDYFAKKHQCFILFVHHINKAAYKLSPHQQHIQGGGGLVQKVRLAMQLSQGEGNTKYWTITKGNYCPVEYKRDAMELTFDEKKFLFTRTGRTVPVDMLNTEENKPTQLAKMQELAEEIFNGESLTYKEFCERHVQKTGRAIASAYRDHKTMKQLELICKAGKKWAINK